MKINKADLLKFKALKTAIEIKKVDFLIDYNFLHKPGSPVYNPWDVVLPLLLVILFSMSLLVLYGIYIGLLTLVLALVLYVYGIRKIQAKCLKSKILKYMLKNHICWGEIWSFGGVAINIKGGEIRNSVIAPEGDWKDFAVLNFADLMIDDKKEEENVEETNS